jgi:hypothetical protein
VGLKCKILQLSIYSSLYLKHDLQEKRRRIYHRSKWKILIIFYKVFSTFIQLQRSSKNTPAQNHSVKLNKTTSNIIGGGHLLAFNGDELIPYSQIEVPEKNIKYKFESHIIQDSI